MRPVIEAMADPTTQREVSLEQYCLQMKFQHAVLVRNFMRLCRSDKTLNFMEILRDMIATYPGYYDIEHLQSIYSELDRTSRPFEPVYRLFKVMAEFEEDAYTNGDDNYYALFIEAYSRQIRQTNPHFYPIIMDLVIQSLPEQSIPNSRNDMLFRILQIFMSHVRDGGVGRYKFDLIIRADIAHLRHCSAVSIRIENSKMIILYLDSAMAPEVNVETLQELIGELLVVAPREKHKLMDSIMLISSADSDVFIGRQKSRVGCSSFSLYDLSILSSIDPYEFFKSIFRVDSPYVYSLQTLYKRKGLLSNGAIPGLFVREYSMETLYIDRLLQILHEKSMQRILDGLEAQVFSQEQTRSSPRDGIIERLLPLKELLSSFDGREAQVFSQEQTRSSPRDEIIERLLPLKELLSNFDGREAQVFSQEQTRSSPRDGIIERLLPLKELLSNFLLDVGRLQGVTRSERNRLNFLLCSESSRYSACSIVLSGGRLYVLYFCLQNDRDMFLKLGELIRMYIADILCDMGLSDDEYQRFYDASIQRIECHSNFSEEKFFVLPQRVERELTGVFFIDQYQALKETSHDEFITLMSSTPPFSSAELLSPNPAFFQSSQNKELLQKYVPEVAEEICLRYYTEVAVLKNIQGGAYLCTASRSVFLLDELIIPARRAALDIPVAEYQGIRDRVIAGISLGVEGAMVFSSSVESARAAAGVGVLRPHPSPIPLGSTALSSGVAGVGDDNSPRVAEDERLLSHILPVPSERGQQHSSSCCWIL